MSKRDDDTHLTRAQFELMDLFWSHGELGVARVRKLLAARRRRVVARNTVQTMIARLAGRGWLKARSEGNAFYYRAARPRDSAVTGMLATLLDTAFAGSASGLAMALLESRRISKDEARRIRELIDRVEREAPDARKSDRPDRPSPPPGSPLKTINHRRTQRTSLRE